MMILLILILSFGSICCIRGNLYKVTSIFMQHKISKIILSKKELCGKINTCGKIAEEEEK